MDCPVSSGSVPVVERVIVSNPANRTLSVRVLAPVCRSRRREATRVAQPHQLAIEIRRVVQVVGERLLVPDRLDFAVDLDRAVVDPPRQVEQVRAVGLSEAGDHRRLVDRGEIADGVDAEPLEPLERDRPDAPQALDRERVQELELAPGNDLDHAGARIDAVGMGDRLRLHRRQLGEELVRRDADRAAQVELGPHVVTDPAGDRNAVAEQPGRLR